MLCFDEKWPYKQLSKYDDEQAIIKSRIKESYVAFIDVLGFKNMVTRNIDDVILALRYIKLFRDSFYSLPSRAGTPADHLLNLSMSEEEYEAELPKATMFSDSIVISQDINNLSSFSDFIEFIALMQFELLREGILIRGGIDIGELYHDDSFVFGEGLVSAYSLESKTAIYPRIVVSQKAIERVNSDIESQFEAETKRYFFVNGKKYYMEPFNLEKYYIKDEFFYISYDDQYYIDYLRLGLEILKASSDEYFEIGIQLMSNFYEDTLSKIIQVIRTGLDNQDERVRQKYMWLQTSYNSNIKIYLRTYKGRFNNTDLENQFFSRWAKKFLV